MKKIARRIAAAAAFATVAGGAVLAIGGAASAETLPGGAHARTATTVSAVKKVESRSVSRYTTGRDSHGGSQDSSRRNKNDKNSWNRRGSDKDVQNPWNRAHKSRHNQHGTDNHHQSTRQDSKKTR